MGFLAAVLDMFRQGRNNVNRRFLWMLRPVSSTGRPGSEGVLRKLEIYRDLEKKAVVIRVIEWPI